MRHSILENTGPKRDQTVDVFVSSLAGQEFLAMNGGPAPFKFNDAISLSVDCKDQAELDRIWNALLKDDGQPQQCGWITGRFGIAWQIVPDILDPLMALTDKAKAARVMDAMLMQAADA